MPRRKPLKPTSRPAQLRIMDEIISSLLELRLSKPARRRVECLREAVYAMEEVMERDQRELTLLQPDLRDTENDLAALATRLQRYQQTVDRLMTSSCRL